MRVGLARNNIYLMAGIDQCRAQVANVDTLATGIRIAAITQQTDSQGFFFATVWQSGVRLRLVH